MLNVTLINPNTSVATTDRMVEIARAAFTRPAAVTGLTAQYGASLIVDAAQLATASQAVASLVPAIAEACDGVIVSAFGDPGLEHLRQQLRVPVAGIGEAGLLEAAHGGRRFAVVTTTPGLAAGIDAMVARLGLTAHFCGVILTDGDPLAVTADPVRLETALAGGIETAITRRGALAVVIGGGPLAVAARALAPHYAIPIVEPIPAAVRWLERTLASRS